MSKDLRFAMLLDCYGEFLTPHQYRLTELYYCADLSLSEIAEIVGITRQGVRDGIKRGELCETAKLLKARGVKTIRINTNGLSDLIHGRKTAADLKGLVDIVSVSLNSGTEAESLKVTRPKYGAVAYPAMQQFALDCKQYVPQVMFSVVDILPKPELEAAQQLADRLGIHLRIRQFDNAATRRNG